MEEKNKFMKQALKEAKKAYEKLEVPVGAIIVKNGKIIARAHNQKETKFDTTKHAEILAIQKALYYNNTCVANDTQDFARETHR